MEIQSQINTGDDNVRLSKGLQEIGCAINDTIILLRDRWSGLLDINNVVPGSAPLDIAQFGMPEDKSIAPDAPFSEAEAA